MTRGRAGSRTTRQPIRRRRLLEILPHQQLPDLIRLDLEHGVEPGVAVAQRDPAVLEMEVRERVQRVHPAGVGAGRERLVVDGEVDRQRLEPLALARDQPAEVLPVEVVLVLAPVVLDEGGEAGGVVGEDQGADDAEGARAEGVEEPPQGAHMLEGEGGFAVEDRGRLGVDRAA
ncbi:MAG: hypothetical protein Q9214_007969, partial [Letrouitia sp. 1 TL-2023]